MRARYRRFAGYPGDQINAAGQEGIIESAWIPIVPLRGMHGAHVRPGLGPVDGGPPAPRVGGKWEREYGERSQKTPQIEREAK
jgi:hypothetical protein